MESAITFHLFFLVLAWKVCLWKTPAESNSVGDISSTY